MLQQYVHYVAAIDRNERRRGGIVKSTDDCIAYNECYSGRSVSIRVLLTITPTDVGGGRT